MFKEGMSPAERSLKAPDKESTRTESADFQEMFNHHLEMYQLPGDQSLTEKDVERYMKSTDELKANLTNNIEQNLDSDDMAVRVAAAEILENVPEADRDRLREKMLRVLPEALEDGELLVRIKAAKIIAHLPEENQLPFREKLVHCVKEGLEDGRVQIGEIALAISESRSESELIEIIEWALKHQYVYVEEYGCLLIAKTSKTNQNRLRAELFRSAQEDLKDQENPAAEHAARFIPYLAESDRGVVIRQLLQREEHLRVRAAEYIGYVPEADRTKIIQECFQDKDIYLHVVASKFIKITPEEDQALLREQVVKSINEALLSEDTFTRGSGGMLIQNAPENRRTELILQALKDKTDGIREVAAKAISSAPEADRPYLIQTALQCLRTPNKGLESALGSAPQAEKPSLYAQYVQGLTDIKKFAAETPLYKKQKNRFFRAQFEKTGSGTTLLDQIPGQPENSLRNQAIIRHIDVGPFLSWEAAYEDTEGWRSLGFDYVPVEPIVKVKLEAGLKTKVFTRVLRGPSVEAWQERTGLYAAEIEAQMEKIRGQLTKLNIHHGHAHAGNFIVVFNRDEQDNVILEEPPRVYVIDFDQATSTRE